MPSVEAWILTQAGASALVSARAFGLAATAPALAVPGTTWRLRLGLAVLLASLLVPVVGGGIAVPSGWLSLGQACLAETIIGAMLGLSAALVIAGARQAGEIVGAQAGLAPAALFDPDAGDEMTALGHLYALVALAAFLALDGPVVLVGVLVESYRVVPAGGARLSEETAELAFGRVGEALALALRAAAPAALALAMAGLALGLLSRAAPSLPLVALSLPVRAVLGLILTGLALVTVAGTFSAAWSSWPGGW